MSTPRTAAIVDDHTILDAYCTRHRIDHDAAIAELVNMALGLPADILDYLREQKAA